MKVTPEKSYEVEVYYNEMLCRWYAKFDSVKAEISYEFPLTDVASPDYDHRTMVANERPTLTEVEERILALVFSQMVATIRAAQARRVMADQLSRAAQLVPAAPGGATESALTS